MEKEQVDHTHMDDEGSSILDLEEILVNSDEDLDNTDSDSENNIILNITEQSFRRETFNYIASIGVLSCKVITAGGATFFAIHLYGYPTEITIPITVLAIICEAVVNLNKFSNIYRFIARKELN